MSQADVAGHARAADLPDALRAQVRDLILVLADSKRLLGMRFGQWILGAPELEAGIACASMAQDEWGHGRLLYALLRDFGEDVDRLEHGRSADAYASMEALDREPSSWIELVALNVFVDAALTVQLEALSSSSYQPLRQRVQKLLEEESFHAAHGTAWLRRIASANEPARDELAAATTALLPQVLRWFGPDSAAARNLEQAGVTTAVGSALRTGYLARVAPLLDLLGIQPPPAAEAAFEGYDETRRRGGTTAPDARTIEQVRGDRNRAFLME